MTDYGVTTDDEDEKVRNYVNEDHKTELESAIIKQIEYYFGDVNLSRDKFLCEQIELDEGWVPLETLIKFNRLAKLTTDPDAVANALDKSTSGLLEVSKENKKVRRSPKMPLTGTDEERRQEFLNRTVYVDGFPEDCVLDDLLKFFENHNEVESIKMRRYMDKQSMKLTFNGSLYATFKTMEQAEKFMSNVASGHIKYEESVLRACWQEDLSIKQQNKAENEPCLIEWNVQDTDKKIKKFQLPVGTVLHFRNRNRKMVVENIKHALKTLGADIKFIDFKSGDPEGFVRLAKKNTAKEIFEKMSNGKIKVGKSKVVFRVLEGEEEKKYLEGAVEQILEKRKEKQQLNKRSFGNELCLEDLMKFVKTIEQNEDFQNEYQNFF